MTKKSFIERMGLILVSSLSLYFMSFTVYSDIKVSRQRTLFYQLQILRMGINIYQLVNHTNPDNLWDVATKTYNLPGDPTLRRYVDGFGIDEMGRINDPFGRPYSYDPIAGWVRSVSSGYEFW